MQDGTLVVADSLTAVKETGVAPMLAAATRRTRRRRRAQRSGHPRAVGLDAAHDPGDPATSPQNADAVMNGAGGLPDNKSLSAYYLEQTYGQVDFQAIHLRPASRSRDRARRAGRTPMRRSTPGSTRRSRSSAPASSSRRTSTSSWPSRPSAPAGSTACSGVAEVGGKNVWVNGDFSVRVLAHELGHNLGLAHAGGLAVHERRDARARWATRAIRDGREYDDPFDAMGRSHAGNGVVAVRQMSMQHKLELNLLPPSAVKVVGAPGHLSHRADGDARAGRGRVAAAAETRRRQLLRRVPAPDRLLRQPAAGHHRRADPHGVAADLHGSREPECGHRADRHASRRPGPAIRPGRTRP